jgi:hypothetical protein
MKVNAVHRAQAALVGVATILGAGCSALTAVKGGADTATQGAGDIKGVKGAGEGLAKDAEGAVGDVKGALGKVKPKSKDGDPDGDGTRIAAVEAKPNMPLTDELDPKKKDVNDWRAFDLPGTESGPVVVQLHWDNEAADLDVDLYDQLGANVAVSPERGPSPFKQVAAKMEPGRAYVRISSKKGATVYTMKLKWEGAPPPKAPAVAEAEKSGADAGGEKPGGRGKGHGAASHEAASPSGAAPPAAGAPAGGTMAASVAGAPAGGAGGAPAAGAGGPAPAPGSAPPADDPNHPRARIVSSYREGNSLVLYLDKGSAAGVRAGMGGNILEGDGDKMLDGGAFKITKVVDATKSIGQSGISKVGKNNKVVIHLAK